MMAAVVPHKIQGVCSTPGCGRPYYAKGLCRRCYARFRRIGTVEYQGRRKHHYVGVPATCPLTVTQFEILCDLAAGITTKQISIKRTSTVGSVNSQISRARRRLNVTTTSHAVALCQQEGWLTAHIPGATRDPPLSTVLKNYEQSFTALIKTSPTARDRLFEELVWRVRSPKRE
jgi:DNA-binding CsgD family transcriptional regulator